MGMTVKVEGLDSLRRKGGSLNRDVRESVVDQVHREMRGFEAEMHTRAAAYGKISQIAASSLGVDLYRLGADVRAGGRGGLPATLLMGAEFGGRKRRRTYISEWHGEFYLIQRRRTTMMFKASVGPRGYFFFPTLRSGLRGQHERMLAAGQRGGQK